MNHQFLNLPGSLELSGFLKKMGQLSIFSHDTCPTQTMNGENVYFSLSHGGKLPVTLLGCIIIFSITLFPFSSLPAGDTTVVSGNTTVEADADTTTIAAGDTYTVQKHDTLWSITEKTGAPPETWPEIWELNRHITNPHWISPGDTIHLHQQPSPGLPADLPRPISNVPSNAIPVNPPYHFFYPLMDTVGTIKTEEPVPMGKILDRKPKFQKDIQEGTAVYLHMADESLIEVGDQFRIVRIIDLANNVNMPMPGIQHYITGVVEITSLKPIPCECHEQISMIEGEIVTAHRKILPGDILLPYNSMETRIAVKKSNPHISGTILFSEEHAAPIKENAVVFIDKGRLHGLGTGQYYEIFNRPKGVPDSSGEYIEKTEHIGSLMVIGMEDEISAALITYSYKPIAPGDLFFPPM
ncbi:MAG: LysM peptidoglycan-binding domain-containing protein [Desulfamplus sp.]|nr:LysM peptidoglycan-binding domain-containing protein [Desulfamplus sp.]